MIVVDANIIAYSVVESEHTGDAHKIASIDPQWILPPLWQFEVTSAITNLVVGKALTRQQAATAIGDANLLVRGRERAVDQAKAMRTAVDLKISAYDAQYVALAEEYGIQLVTTDIPLTRRAPSLAILLNKFVVR